MLVIPFVVGILIFTASLTLIAIHGQIFLQQTSAHAQSHTLKPSANHGAGFCHVVNDTTQTIKLSTLADLLWTNPLV